jgi:DNA anti-recombination protein RmuC
MRVPRLNIALYVALVFLSGIVVGVFGDRLYTVKTVNARPTPDEWRKRLVLEMQSRLKLRPDQVSRLNTVLDETRTRVHEVHEKSRPEMEAIRQRQTEQIRAMLDEGQRAEYEKMRTEREQKAKTGGGGPGI